MSGLQTMVDIEASGELDGYRRGFPSGLVDGGDSDVCMRAGCGRCGHRGLECHGFVAVRGRSYRAFAVCPSCLDAREF